LCVENVQLGAAWCSWVQLGASVVGVGDRMVKKVVLELRRGSELDTS
jgi:hypothetical protein